MDPDAALRIELAVQAGDWSAVDAEHRTGPIERAVAGRLDTAVGTMTLVLADDAMVRDLNRRFRGKDKPTNVLSFPADEPVEAGMADADRYLGDVVVAAETLAREAHDEGKAVEHHFDHLVVHGTLHLLGYDHESDKEADRMESLETAILADLGIADPYAEPALPEGAR